MRPVGIVLASWLAILGAGQAAAAPPKAAVPAAVLAALAAGESADGCYPPLSSGGFRYRGAR